MKQKLLASLLRDFFAIIDPNFLASVSQEIELEEVPAGTTLIAQGSTGSDV